MLRVLADAECRLLRADATRKTKGQFTAVFTKRPLRRSWAIFARADATSVAENRPRKTPNSNAFPTSRACSVFSTKGARTLWRYRLALDVFASGR